MVDIINKGDTRKNLKWFPGHMKKALEDIEDNKIKLADVILYVLDARAPFSCMNPNVNKIVHGKPIIYVFNKTDLADEKRVAEIMKEFEHSGKTCIKVSANNSQFRGDVKNALKVVLSEKIERNRQKLYIKCLFWGFLTQAKARLSICFVEAKKQSLEILQASQKPTLGLKLMICL